MKIQSQDADMKLRDRELFIIHDSIVFLTENKANVYFLHSLSLLEHEIY